jgi:hypothetical protein
MTPSGKMRRNRRHITPRCAEGKPKIVTPKDNSLIPVADKEPVVVDDDGDDVPKQMTLIPAPELSVSPSNATTRKFTRSGREIKKPIKLDM